MKDLLNVLIGPVTGISDKVMVDKDQVAKLAHDIATMVERCAQEAMLAQIAVNKAEAKGTGFRLRGDCCAVMFASPD